jgi:release factor glutamine methyltransferase
VGEQAPALRARAVPPVVSGGEARVAAVVGELARTLAQAGVPEARHEARDIVAALLDMPRFWPSLHPDEVLEPAVVEAAHRAASRRAAGAPFAYAVGRAAFRHLTLDVDERVLIPRQETEVLVDVVLEQTADGSGGVVVDVGTGSGAIALALATEAGERFDRVIATDLSLGALAVARANVDRLAPALRAPIELRQGSLLEPVRDVRVRVLVSNPPYIAYDEARTLPRSVRDWEPPIALFGGADGLAATRAIIAQAAEVLEPGGLLALEIDPRRASTAAGLALADDRYHHVSVRLDLAGRERILLARRRDE